jgi:PleD family two-component response regulator
MKRHLNLLYVGKECSLELDNATITLCPAIENQSSNNFYDCILFYLSSKEGFLNLSYVLGKFNEIPVLIISPLEDETLSVLSIKAGVQDFVHINDPETCIRRAIVFAIERHHLRSVESKRSTLLETQIRMMESNGWGKANTENRVKLVSKTLEKLLQERDNKP